MPNSSVEILIPSSPIPSHPSTEIIDGTISRIRSYKELEDAKILLMLDGVGEHLKFKTEYTQKDGILDSPEENLRDRTERYTEYKKRLRARYSNENVDFIEFEKHTHVANMTRVALEQVTTPTVITSDHGCSPKGDIPWKDLFVAMQDPRVNFIRMYYFEDIHPDHKHLFETKRHYIAGVPLIRTIQYGGQECLHRTDWFKYIIKKYVWSYAKHFVESVMWPVCFNAGFEGWSEFKLWCYAPEKMANYWIVNDRYTDPIADCSVPMGLPG